MNRPCSTRSTETSLGERCAPLVGSLIVHLALLSGLALIVIRENEATPPREIVTSVADQEAPRAKLELVTTSPLPATGDSSRSPLSAEALLAEVAQDRLEATPRAELARPLELGLVGVSAGALAAPVGLSAGGSRGSGAAGRDGSEGTGGGGKFFGTDVRGASVVFVVDNSGSMSVVGKIPREVAARNPRMVMSRMARVKLELMDAIGQMTPRQRFFVIFFNSRAMPMPASQMVAATPEAKQACAEWVFSIGPQGGTEPEEALLLALRLRPDEIYFLTDGQFRGNAVTKIARSNPGRIPIHTICFGDSSGEKLMKNIAELSGGTYRFIPDGFFPDE